MHKISATDNITEFKNVENSIPSRHLMFKYDGEDLILEFNQNNAVKALFVHGEGIDDPLMMIRDENDNQIFEDREVYAYTKDHLGSIREIVDYNGETKQRYSYSSYGETKITKVNPKNELIDSPYAYISRELDLESGDMFYRARYYSPSEGRFVSEDPIYFYGRDTNLYRYVGNKPVYINDPSGKVAPVVIGGAFGAVIGGLTSGYLASKDSCATKGDIALAALKGAGIGAITGALATVSGLGGKVAFDSSAGILATSTKGSAVASLFGDVLGIAATIETGLSAGSSSSGSCGCKGK